MYACGVSSTRDNATHVVPEAAGRPWTIFDAADLYGVDRWGGGYFRVNDAGNVACHPNADGEGVDLRELMDELGERGVRAPVLLRFTDILRHRLGAIAGAFERQIAEAEYRAAYRCVYPVKVNQSRLVVEDVHRFGREHGFGLEAGSKPELLAVLSVVDDDETPIICNGFKDEEFIEAVILAKKIGRNIVPVVEKLSEVELIVKHAKLHGAVPDIGVRVKLSSKGAGRWEQSGGVRSKFGLFVSEVIRAHEYLTEHGMGDALSMLHFHLGSQIHQINNLRDAIGELARVYVELRAMGATGLTRLDVGGGLGVDYDGSNSAKVGSINYGLDEYAADVIWQVKEVCDRADEPHPEIVSESGRAMVAYHAALIFDVIGWSGFTRFDVPPSPAESERKSLPLPLVNLFDAHADVATANLVETFHDIEQARGQVEDLFRLGHCTLRQRADGETLFFATAGLIRDRLRGLDLAQVPEELRHLETLLSDTYFCNLSIFQSMPDSWAIDQLFPICPIHRLDERPTCNGIIADVTCDSDGKIDHFIHGKSVLPLHPPAADLEADPYLIGAFLVGAYQEILGDLHNLFGDTHVVHVAVDEAGGGGWSIDELVQGDTCADVLKYVNYEPRDMVRSVRQSVERALREKKITNAEGRQFLRFYEDGLAGYTYLE